MFWETTFTLLDDLARHNDKEWFDAHRDEVKRHLQEPFEALLEEVTAQLAGTEIPLKGGGQTMFRMNRDVRFSNDKRPYHEHVSGVLTPSGTKAEAAGVLYLNLDAHGGFMAAGRHKLNPKDLGPLRDRIVERPEQFRAVLDELDRAGLSLSEDLKLKSMPQGYADHADAWYADHLKLQSFTVRLGLAPGDWTSGKVANKAAKLAGDTAGLLRFW